MNNELITDFTFAKFKTLGMKYHGKKINKYIQT